MSAVAERGAVPRVPAGGRRVLGLLRTFTSPLLPDDYLELVNPLWSTRELRGRVVGVERHTADAASIVIKPGWRWPGHRAGQYLRLGVDIDGVRHWRAYSLSSDPHRADGCIAITPKLVDGGRVSSHLLRRVRPGDVVTLGGVEGQFVLGDPPPARTLFVSAGSGITPVMSMLRSLASGARLRDTVHVHSERTREGIVFAAELRALRERHAGYSLHARITGEQGRLRAAQLEQVCPDWRERETFVCGPPALVAELRERFERDGDPRRLHVERFQADERVGDGERGAGGAIEFCISGVRASSDGSQPILVAGERAGATLPHGCRMGICHSCVGRLRAGRVRDLRSGRVHGEAGALVRTCINAPEGAVEIDL